MTRRPTTGPLAEQGPADSEPAAHRPAEATDLMSPSPLLTLLKSATLAPSGDNTQPWLLLSDPRHGEITFRLDPSRDPSPMNAGQRMSRIAVGAALENAVRTAIYNGWEVSEAAGGDSDLAALEVRHDGQPGEVESLLRARVTNRRLYDGRVLNDETVRALHRATQDDEDVQTHWICDRSQVAHFAQLISRADTAMFGDRAMRRAFLSNVRFDLPAAAEVEEGLSLASLELKTPDRVGLRLMGALPEAVVKYSGALSLFALHARKLVRSASGLCIITAASENDVTDLRVGRALQRAWLALVAAGLQVQPMMSLPVLDNVLAHAPHVDDRTRRLARAVLDDWRAALDGISPARTAVILRLGYAAPPSGRTGRLPIERVVQA